MNFAIKVLVIFLLCLSGCSSKKTRSTRPAGTSNSEAKNDLDNQKNSASNSDESDFVGHVILESEGACMEVKLPDEFELPDDADLPDDFEFNGPCPDELTIADSELELLLTCDSYRDEKNDDPALYTWHYYEGKLDEDSDEIVSISESEAESSCDKLPNTL